MANQMLRKWSLDDQCQKSVVIVVAIEDKRFWVARSPRVPVYAAEFNQIFADQMAKGDVELMFLRYLGFRYGCGWQLSVLSFRFFVVVASAIAAFVGREAQVRVHGDKCLLILKEAMGWVVEVESAKEGGVEVSVASL
uniref:BTB domain-containing protein n=1 Tax=Parascaris equorum TaxID=6256 RepID=A0A914RC04_PAREQ